jgi:hypothetical protein
MSELNPDPQSANSLPPKSSELRGGAQRWSFAHALLFTGHMIDSADRRVPRFPAWAEERARDAIRQAVARIAEARNGTTIGLAGGASGGDLLFHEACAELNIPTRILLALPLDDFIRASVAPAGPGWVERLHALIAERSPENLRIMGGKDGQLDGETDNVWQRANLWIIEEAVALAPEGTLLALWDGQTGDGPGGTEHFVTAARRWGVRIAPPIEMQDLLRD